MKKADCIAYFAENFGTTKIEAEKMFSFVLDFMYDSALKDGKCVFGPHQMVRKEYKARNGVNPQTGEQISIPAKTKVGYKRLNRS